MRQPHATEPMGLLSSKRFKFVAFRVCAAFVCLLVVTVVAPTPKVFSQGISEQEAIRLAENFVSQQGYADSPADTSQLQRQPEERGLSIEEILRNRRDFLYPRAYGLFHRKKDETVGWTVIFCLKRSNRDPRSGVGISMNFNGSNIHLEQPLIWLGAAKKFISPCQYDLFLDSPNFPARIGYMPLGAYYTLENHSDKRIVRYRLGCAIEENGWVKISSKKKEEVTDLPPADLSKNNFPFTYLDVSQIEERCVSKAAKIAVVGITFADGTIWKLEEQIADWTAARIKGNKESRQQ